MPDTPLPQLESRGIPQAADPFALFGAWMAEASASEVNDPNAMTVATCTPGGMPSARIVLLKDFDPQGFVFYTNKEGRKGQELRANPQAALLFHWKTLQRQVRVEGQVEDVTDAEADAYYASRARVSRLGAWASDQSRPLPARDELERRVREYDARFPGEAIPPPAALVRLPGAARADRVLAGHAVPPARPPRLYPHGGRVGDGGAVPLTASAGSKLPGSGSDDLPQPGPGRAGAVAAVPDH